MEGPSVVNGGDDFIMDLPPGFRFHPTDEEIITHYLTQKVMNRSFSARAVGEVDLNKCEPWDLPKKAKMGEKEWYFFCQRDRKYPTGMRTNRATESGYWKATGKDKEIYRGKGRCLVGMKKTLVFYKGRAPKGEKTNWVMHEYRLEGKFSYYNFPKAAKEEWVVSRIFHKNTGIKRNPITGPTRMNSFGDDLLDCPNSLPPLMDPPPIYSNNEKTAAGSSFTDIGEDEIKGTGTASSERSSDGDYLSYFSANENELQKQVLDHKNILNIMPHNNYSSTTRYQGCPSNPTPPNSIFYPDQIQLPNPVLYPFQLASTNLAYWQQKQERMGTTVIPSFTGSSSVKVTDEAILRALAVKHGTTEVGTQHCKVEQFSSSTQSKVSVSQDTGLSNDMTAETSSVISTKDMGSNKSYEDRLEDPSVGPISDLDCLLNYL